MKPYGDLAGRQAPGREAQHLNLTVGESTGVIGPQTLAGAAFVVATRGGGSHGHLDAAVD
jgi:hypothetical protein